jgi:hypothetical protein
VYFCASEKLKNKEKLKTTRKKTTMMRLTGLTRLTSVFLLTGSIVSPANHECIHYQPCKRAILENIFFFKPTVTQPILCWLAPSPDKGRHWIARGPFFFSRACPWSMYVGQALNELSLVRMIYEKCTANVIQYLYLTSSYYKKVTYHRLSSIDIF